MSSGSHRAWPARSSAWPALFINAQRARRAGPVAGVAAGRHPLARTQLLQGEPQDVAGLGPPPSEASNPKEAWTGLGGPTAPGRPAATQEPSAGLPIIVHD